jgi:hypothetical protein
MTIPEEAVKAAWMALYDGSYVENATRLDMRRALQAAGPYLMAAEVIATEEELDALPAWSVVLSEAYTHHRSGKRIAFQRWDDDDWHRGGRAASTHPDNFLPATVLYRG